MGKNLKGKECGKGISRASIKTTMDRYVHVTDESLFAAVHQFENKKQLVKIGVQQTIGVKLVRKASPKSKKPLKIKEK